MASRPWSATTEITKLEHDFEETLDHFMRHDWGVATHPPGSHHAPAIESFIDSGKLVIRIELPGVAPEDVEIDVNENLLTIRGSRVADAEEEGRNFVHREHRYGSFARAISIPMGVRKEDITVGGRHGVLELTVPLPDGEGIRRVPVEKLKRHGEPEEHE